MNRTNSAINRSQKRENVVSWAIAFLFFLSLLPYFVWSIVPYTDWWLTVPLFLLFCTQTKRIKNSHLLVSFIFISIWAGICGGGNFVGISMMAVSAIIFAVKESFLISIYSRFRLIFVLLLSASLIIYLLVSFGVSLPYYSVPPPPRNTIDYNYYIYPFYACPSVDDWRNLGINRFNALFDEPGVVGTISFIILFIEKFNLKKIGNYVLIASGILSFSLFFYIASFIYFTYHLFFIRSNYFYKILTGLVVSFCLLQFAKTEIFEGYIGDRLLWESKAQTISGDDRSSDDLKKHISNIRGTTAYFFGDPESVSRHQASASIEKQILAYGFITIALFFIFYAIYSHRYLKTSKEWVFFYVVLFAIMYNRPSMFSFSRLYLYCMMVLVWSPNFKDSFQQLDIATTVKNRLLRRF